jgi:hypothetical protein
MTNLGPSKYKSRKTRLTHVLAEQSIQLLTSPYNVVLALVMTDLAKGWFGDLRFDSQQG